AEQRAVLADAAMILLMVDHHGEAVLCLGVLRAHLGSRAYGGGHLLEGLGPNEVLLPDRPPQPVQISHGAAETQVRVICHTVFICRHIAASKLAISMRKSVHQREIIAIGSGLYACWFEDILLHVFGKSLSGHALHNRDQKLKAGDGAVPLCSRLIDPILPCVERHDFIQCFGLAAGAFDGIAKIVVINYSRSVVEQLANAYMMALQRKFRDEP